VSNYITVYGNLTRDPEVRRTKKDMAIVTGGIASNRREKRTGDGAAEAEWENVATFFDYKFLGKRGETFARFHKKGSRAFLVGSITTESWVDKKTGEERSKQVLLANEWEFCNASGESGEDGPDADETSKSEGSTGFPWERK